MQYGLALPNRGTLAMPDSLATMARRAEQLGFHSLHIGDHIAIPSVIRSRYPYTPDGSFVGAATGEALEQLTVLSYLAGVTNTIRLVTSVMVVPYRNPLVAAKVLATLDVLSEGRLILGIGVEWMREEFEALALPAFEARGKLTNEYVMAYKELWTRDNSSFQGDYCHFSDVRCRPQPVQKPHPPIWVGGESPHSIRRAAEISNGWIPIGTNPAFPMGTLEQLTHGIKRLASHAETMGRDPSEFEIVFKTFDMELTMESRTSTAERPLFKGSPEEIAVEIRRYEQIGVTQLAVGFVGITSLEDMIRSMEDFADQVWPLV